MELLIAGALSLLIGTVHAANLPDVPDGAQALTLTGKPLYAAPRGQNTLDPLAEARKNYEANPNDADNIIWFGRRTAYSGDFRRYFVVLALLNRLAHAGFLHGLWRENATWYSRGDRTT